MKSILLGLVISVVVEGIRRTSPYNVYPGSNSGIDLSNVLEKDEPATLMWASNEPMVIYQEKFRTSRSSWNASDSNLTTCAGYLRYGSDDRYTVPVASNVMNSSCSVDRLRESLWATKLGPPGDCQCRRPLSMKLTRQIGQSTKCFSEPSEANGWPLPGLVDCSMNSELVTEVVYHQFSGQIRSGQMCLTAEPYSTYNLSSAPYKPWAVKLSLCSNDANGMARQSWDVASGVGDVPFNLGISANALDIGRPSGHSGRIFLRDSADIGQRCLEIAYDMPASPLKVPAMFLEAVICEDTRFTPADVSIWRFIEGTRPVDSPNEWKACSTPSCSDCYDGELRARIGIDYTQEVSVPYGFDYSSPFCSVTDLRRMTIPDITDGRCFCQTHNLFSLNRTASYSVPEMGYIISATTDDLPSTKRPSFPARNQTLAASTVTRK